MVLGILAVRGPPKAPHGKIEAWRAILPFVVTVRREIADFEGRALGPQDMLDRAIDVRGETPTALIVDGAPVADAGKHQAMLDSVCRVLVAKQTCDRPERARHEQEAISVTMRGRLQSSRESGRNSHAGEIVIAQ